MARRRKKSKAAAANRINELPNEILCRILSFLPTKQAVATSILSKRWIRLWISVPIFNLTNITIDCIESNYKFNESVYAVLASRASEDYSVDSFHLDVQYGTRHLAYTHSFPHVVRWINLVVQRKLKHLHLNHEIDDQDIYEPEQEYYYYLPRLPTCILTCRTLVSLNIRRFDVEGYCVSSVEFGFPLLKTLHMNYFYFGNDRNFVSLLSGCPVLEDLQLINSSGLCFWLDPIGLQMFKNLSFPKLTRADITKCYWSFYPLKAFSTAKSLCFDTLKLYTEDDEENQLQQPRHYDDIPIFHNLTHLKLHNSWNLVLQMLNNCPKLQSLKLSQEWNRGGEDNQENPVEEPEIVPQCLSSCLRTCNIQDMGGLQSELMLATFILKNAKNLQTMKIRTQLNRDEHEIEAKLSLCPKASATCQLLMLR